MKPDETLVPGTNEEIIRLAKTGVPPIEISRRVLRSQNAVNCVIYQARQHGEDIPRFRRQPQPRLYIHDTGAEERLLDHAGKRGISVAELMRRIVAAVTEGDLVDAVLDDAEDGDD